MQFSDTSAKAGILQDTHFLASADTTSYPTADVVRSVNAWYYRVLSWIWKAQGTWEFDDYNKTDLPIATTTLVANQQDYSLPTETGTATGGAAYRVIRVEVKDAAGNWSQLKQLDQSEVRGALSEYKETAGLPDEYDIRGNSIFLYCPPASGSVTLTAGLRIYLNRGLDKFVAADTTQEPGFPENYHRVLSLGAAYDFLLTTGDTQKAQGLRAEIEAIRANLEIDYANRNQDKKVRLSPRRELYS